MAATEKKVREPGQGGEISEIDIRVGRVSIARGTALSLLLLLFTLLVLYGILYIARGSPVHGVYVGDSGSLPAVADPRFARTMELHTGGRILPGNGLEVLLNGDSTFPRMWRDMRSARRSLTVQMYYFTPGALADSVSANLVGRAKADVRVLLLLDAFGSHTMSRGWLDTLRDAGVEIQHLRPLKWYKLDRLSHRSHVRSVVIDGEIGYTGGFGFGDFWLGDGHSEEEWRETNLRMTGPAVLQLQAAFMAGWAEATGDLLTGELYFPADTLIRGNSSAALLHFAPSTGNAAAERFLALSIASARSTLFVTNAYFVPDAQFRRMLTDAARRGVDVRVITAGEATDVPMTWYASRARYEELLAGGVRIFEYLPTMIHSKTFVVDGQWLSIGSLNFDSRSLSYNDEANAVALDSVVGIRMNEIFLNDLAQSHEVTLEKFRHRGFWNRFVEFGANLISALL